MANQIKLDIENLAKESKSYSIKKLISVFSEEERAQHFAELAKKTIIECATQGNNRKVDLILEAFPNEQDKTKILNDALLTPFNLCSNLLLAKLKVKVLLEAVGISSPLSTPKATAQLFGKKLTSTSIS